MQTVCPQCNFKVFDAVSPICEHGHLYAKHCFSKQPIRSFKKWNSWFIFIAGFLCRGHVNNVDAAACVKTTEAEFSLSESSTPPPSCPPRVCLPTSYKFTTGPNKGHVHLSGKGAHVMSSLSRLDERTTTETAEKSPADPRGSQPPRGFQITTNRRSPSPQHQSHSLPHCYPSTTAHLPIYRDALLGRIRTWTRNSLGDNGGKIDLVPLP